MKREKLFKMLNYCDSSDDDELSMILSNNIDIGGDRGGLISTKQFGQLINDIKIWRLNKNKKNKRI